MFALSYDEGEVSYSPSHCPFCGDYFTTENIELDFDNDEKDYVIEEDDIDDDDELDFDDR